MLFVAAHKERRPSEMETADDGKNDEFPPEKRLEAPNTRLIKTGIETIPDMETLQECVAYENTVPLNRHRALESGSHVLFDVIDRTHQDDFPEFTVPFTRSDGGAVRALDRGVHRLGH